MAIRARIMDESQVPLVIIGNENKHKRSLKTKYGHVKNILFREAVYDRALLDSLRHYCRIYVHGHSVGGTNPSLLEAMACSCRIVAHDNPFNRFVLGDTGKYFSTENELSGHFSHYNEKEFESLTKQNLAKIKNEYNWDAVTDAYEKLFNDACSAE
jgi:glycosyltransferase involved in cell wall biosynthesis